jgi:ligand-binding sensor domain-containing protein
MKLIQFLLVSFCFGHTVLAQNSMGGWRVHYSANSTVGVANNTNSVFMATQNGIARFDTEDNSISDLTVTNGLSDLNISAIGDNDDVILIGYLNGNLDVLINNEIINVPWIKNAQIAGSKTINNFYFLGDRVYISTNIGIVIYSIEKNEIEDTFYPNLAPEINDVTIFNDTIFAASNNGIYMAALEQNYLNDYNNWIKKTNLPSTLVNSKFLAIESFSDNLFFSYDTDVFNGDSLFKMNKNNEVVNFFDAAPTTINSLSTGDDELIIAKQYNTTIFDLNLNEVTNIFDYSFGTIPTPVQSIKFKDYYWIADGSNGLVKAKSSWESNQVFSNTPSTDGSYRLDIQYGKVMVASGGLTGNLHNNYFKGGVHVFNNEVWNNLNATTQANYPLQMWDVISVAINPNNLEQMAFGSYSVGGMSIINNGEITESYNEFNSPLETQIGNNGTHIIPDMKYDDNGNLWIVNSGVYPLKMLSAEGVWYSYSLGGTAKNKYPYRLTIDSKGNKWVGFSGAGIAVFNENGTYSDISDDELVALSTASGYGSLPSSDVKALAEDIDGEIWIGTETGLSVVYATSTLFDGEYGDADAQEILLKYGEEVEVLLGESSISAIAVDGGNRKWIGTSSSGVFCLSPNGTEESYRFTTENSPLLSDGILDIKVDHVSGEVFFATEAGLISYRADATIADEEFSQVKVFPNPVKPDYKGLITIQGLGYESDVKITDVSGNLIFKTQSNGGTVVWDGNRLSGSRVKSGVYLIWTASVTGKGKNVAKVVVIN